MKKIFISQPMRNKTYNEIKFEREKIVSTLTERFGKVEIINNLIESQQNENALYSLGKSLQLLSNADCVYFDENWKKYRGCRIEHECAIQYEIEIINE